MFILCIKFPQRSFELELVDNFSFSLNLILLEFSDIFTVLGLLSVEDLFLLKLLESVVTLRNWDLIPSGWSSRCSSNLPCLLCLVVLELQSSFDLELQPSFISVRWGSFNLTDSSLSLETIMVVVDIL